MKRYRRLGLLLGVLVLASVATFALSRYEGKKEEIQNSDAIVLEIPAESVTELSWEYEEELAFHRDAGWLYDADESFPVDEDRIGEILSHFESFGVSFIIENVEDYGQYGLDTPACVIHLTTVDQTYDIRLGDFSKMDQKRYVDIGDGNVYLVSEDPTEYIVSELSGMIRHDNTPDFETVEDIRFTGAENYTIVHTDESSDTYNSEEDIYFVERKGESVPLDTDSVRNYLDTVTDLKLQDYVTYNVTMDELETYGLDDPLLSVTINYTGTDEDGETVSGSCVFHISENPRERAEADVAEEDSEEKTVTKYIRIGDSQIVYILDDAEYTVLSAAAYDDLRHDEVFWADFGIVTQIDITLEGNEHTLISRMNEEEREWHYRNAEATAEEDSEAVELTEADTDEDVLDLSSFESALLALTADSFTDEAPAEAEEIGMVLHLENENFPTVKIQLYRYNGSLCLAVVDGKTVSLVSRSAVMELVEAVQEIVLN